jgi:hypothetical protein
MVPNKSSSLLINDLDAAEVYALNSISGVALDRDLHGKFGLSDLIVELSHFID